MKPLPRDPFAFQARVMGALTADLFDLGAGKTKTFDRLNALHSTAREGSAAQEAAPENQ